MVSFDYSHAWRQQSFTFSSKQPAHQHFFNAHWGSASKFALPLRAFEGKINLCGGNLHAQLKYPRPGDWHPLKWRYIYIYINRRNMAQQTNCISKCMSQKYRQRFCLQKMGTILLLLQVWWKKRTHGCSRFLAAPGLPQRFRSLPRSITRGIQLHATCWGTRYGALVEYGWICF